MNFNQLGLTDRVLEGIKDAGFETCTNVQEMVLPVSLGGRDVIVQSKPGSGKTAVYLLTIMEQYAKRQNAGLPLPVSLVIAPTRELALQIEEDAKLLSKHLDGFRVGCFYGGVMVREVYPAIREADAVELLCPNDHAVSYTHLTLPTTHSV